MMSVASIPAFAQDAASPLKIRGVVCDADGIPVAGAMIKSSNNGNEAITDLNGDRKSVV